MGMWHLALSFQGAATLPRGFARGEPRAKTSIVHPRSSSFISMCDHPETSRGNFINCKIIFVFSSVCWSDWKETLSEADVIWGSSE